MSYTHEKVPLRAIFLDNENPRHDPISNEVEIIHHLTTKEAVKKLARHICKMGVTSPLEMIGIMRHPKARDAFVVLEGNRRVCALKLLQDPDKAKTEADRKVFRDLAKTITLPEEIDVVLFTDRESARPWISLRHEGPQNGIGTKPWLPAQKARFNLAGSAAKNPNIQATRLKEYALARNLVDEKIKDEIKVTTLTRYLSNPVFRNTVGLIDNQSLNIRVPIEEFDRVIQRFISDALSGKAHSRTNKTERVNYVNELKMGGHAPTSHLDVAIDAEAEVASARPANKAKERNNRSPDDRPYIVPSGYVAKIENKVLKRLYDELRTIKADGAEFAVTYLLRAVIEQAVTLFLKKHGRLPNNAELHLKLNLAAGILADGGMTARELKYLNTMANDKNSRSSPDTMGHFVHGGAIPTKKDVIRTWDSIEHVLTKIFGNL